MAEMKMSLERNWLMLYLPRNLKHVFLISSVVPFWAARVTSGTKRLKTSSIRFLVLQASSRYPNSFRKYLHALNSYYEVPLFEVRTLSLLIYFSVFVKFHFVARKRVSM